MTDAIPVRELVARFGSARHPERAPAHARPAGLSDETVDALTELSAALETVEDARGHLYAFHRLSGRADLDLQTAVEKLRDAGHPEIADAVRDVLVGRDTVDGKWSFQLVESYDADYVAVFRSVEQSVRSALGVTAPHLGEAELKAREQR